MQRRADDDGTAIPHAAQQHEGSVLRERDGELGMILLVDDDPQLRKLVAFLLEDAGYTVITATDRSSLLQSIEEALPDLILLDVDLPDASGFELCRQIRAVSNNPIMFLSGYAHTDHKVAGLQSGGDDYMAKPFEPAELLARIAALLRRHNAMRLATTRVRAAGLTVDLAAQQVRFDNGRITQLTPTETKLLHYLMAHAGEIVSVEQLSHIIWQHDGPGTRVRLQVNVNRLRAKIEPDPARPRLITTIRNAISQSMPVLHGAAARSVDAVRRLPLYYVPGSRSDDRGPGIVK